MTVTLPPQLEALVRRKVETGPYRTPDEVVEEALRPIEERDRLARLKAAIAVGDEQLTRGEVVDWTPDFLERLQREAAEEDRQGLPITDDVRP